MRQEEKNLITYIHRKIIDFGFYFRIKITQINLNYLRGVKKYLVFRLGIIIIRYFGFLEKMF